jgi:hypothetical protein
MKRSRFGLAALSAVLLAGFAGIADAAPRKKMRITTGDSNIGRFYVQPGDSRARINRAYPNDANPPSLRQTYNLRWRKMQESRR